MSDAQYKETNCDDLKHLFNGDLVLLVSATDLETHYIHEKLLPLPGYDKIIRLFEGDLTYYLGTLGLYRVAHVQCSMGSISRDSSIMTVTTALEKLKSKIVIMVGIAFGVDDKKQNIGDVLVSESIIPYNIKRVGKETVHRGIEAPSSKTLLNRFKNASRTWEYILPNDIKANLIPTRLLSGEELIDNLDHRDALIKANPDSKGGEMEGTGVYSACDGKADWIVVKAICDFADGAKGVDKKSKQTIAIQSALSLCLEIFNSPSVFKELEVLPTPEDEQELEIPLPDINSILFDIYDSEKEKFYIERDEDLSFNKIINQYGIWIYGPAGCGKSILILRNLIKNKKDFIQISLASCIAQDIDSFFLEILYDLVAKANGTSQTQPKTFAESSRAILEILSHYKGKELIIFIEEIPISTEAQYEEFAGKIFSLIISKNLIGGLENIRFVLSSINNPAKHIQTFQQKVHQQLNFLPFDFWAVENATKLIELIENEVNFMLPKEIKEELLKTSKGSPRFIKKFFRSIYILNKTDEATLRYVLNETQRELSLYGKD